MNKRERVYAAMEGQPVDRVPLSLWRYFHKQDQTPTGLASATLAFYHKYDFDLIKLTPSDFYAIEDWGATVVLSKDDAQPPQLKKTVIRKPEDWRQLSTLNPQDGSYGQALNAIKLITDQLTEADAPLLMTIFSPLTIAYELAGEKLLLEHLTTHPTDVHIGLATIAETTSRFADAALGSGADGIFFISRLSRSDLLDEAMYQAFVVRYDLIALERVKMQPVPLVLHLHGHKPYFDTISQYPVHAVSWHNQRSGPSLTDAFHLTDKALMAGLDGIDLQNSTPQQIRDHIRLLLKQNRGHRLILAPAGPIATTVSTENLLALTETDRSVG